jgi:tetratricopeptide (TPR) repeat protein
MIILSDTEETEVEHLNELGLHSEALDAVERELQIRENTAILWEAITTAMVNKRFDLAVEYAERLKAIPGIKKRHLQLISLAYNYADRSLEAYQCCREAIGRTDNPNEAPDYYTMACRASSIGLQNEAFANILIALVFLPRNDEDILRKAFLDSELAGAWRYAETAEPTLAQALSVYFPDWKYVVQHNTPTEPERWIDHSDLKHIPSEFHSLLKPRCPSTLLSTPLTAALNPDLHRRYLKWQDDQVQPRLLAFSNYMEKVTKLLEDFQGSFAAFQAHKGRFGAARNHLLQILKKSPDADPSRLPEIPLLAPLITEFRNQFAESPEAFSRLVPATCEPALWNCRPPAREWLLQPQAPPRSRPSLGELRTNLAMG